MVIWYIYKILWFCCLLNFLVCEQLYKIQYGPKLPSHSLANALVHLNDICVDSSHLKSPSSTFLICFFHDILNVKWDVSELYTSQSTIIGTYSPKDSMFSDKQIYLGKKSSCSSTNESAITVQFECCLDDHETQSSHIKPAFNKVILPGAKYGTSSRLTRNELNTYIASVFTSDNCQTEIIVCSALVCDETAATATVNNTIPISPPPISSSLEMSKELQKELQERTKKAFYHAYDSYMTYAYPAAELKPISCEGGNFESIKIPYVTLIDSMDTLIIFQNYTEFRHIVSLLHTNLKHFDFDVNVSLFETTIRLLGGLLSAHLMAIDPLLHIYPIDGIDHYNNELLFLSIDLADRLLPAFQSKTGIPYGTVNLHSGVPKGESKLASLAGAGTLLMEFQILSYLTNNATYGMYAYTAIDAIYTRRSELNLVGKHIHIDTGNWHETISSLGSNSDSFYEYLLKSYSLSHNPLLYEMFLQTYDSVHQYIVEEQYKFIEVEMHTGKVFKQKIENLVAFWPGIESLLGYHTLAAKQLNHFYQLATKISFLPEELDYTQYAKEEEITNPSYYLRPELIESTYYHYLATQDRTWLYAGKQFLTSIEDYTLTTCGYANIINLTTMELEDNMPSYFLSETLKYLYLLFDDDNPFHIRSSYIFSTEAHPFDLNQIYQIRKQYQLQEEIAKKEQEQIEKEKEGEETEKQQRQPQLQVQEESTKPAWKSITTRRHSKKQQQQQQQQQQVGTGRQNMPSTVPGFLSDKLKKLFPGSINKSLPQSEDEVAVEVIVEGEEEEGSATTEKKQKEKNTIVSAMRLKCPKYTKWYEVGFYKYSPLPSSSSSSSTQSTSEEQESGNSTDTINTPPSQQQPPQAEDFSSSLRTLRQQKSIAIMKQYLRVFLSRYGDLAVNNNHAHHQQHHVRQKETYLWLTKQPKCQPEDAIHHVAAETSAQQLQQLQQQFATKITRKPGNGQKPPQAMTPQDLEDQIYEVADEMSPIKVVEISLGVLGNFKIKVFTDGFKVFNRLDKRTIEISNVGKRAVFIREYEGFKSGNKRVMSVVGKLGSYALNCLFRVYEHNQTTIANKLVMERHCSTANFGLKPPFSIQAGIYIPTATEDPFVCPRDKAMAAAKKVSTAERLQTWWNKIKGDPLVQIRNNFPFLDNIEELNGDQASSSSLTTTTATNELDGDAIAKKMVMAQRGNCLFEEKAIMIQKHHAAVLVVVNKENTLFVMAGKKEVDEEIRATSAGTTTSASSSPPPSSSNTKPQNDDEIFSETTSAADSQVGTSEQPEQLEEEESIEIPTVMITRNDFLEVEKLMTSQPESEFIGRIDVQSSHAIFQTEMMGNQLYPKVFMTKGIIYIISGGGWGAYFKTQQGNDWQMFLVDKRDISTVQLLPPVQIRSTSGQKLLTTVTLMQPAQNLYKQLLKRKCPNFVHVDKHSRVTKLV